MRSSIYTVETFPVDDSEHPLPGYVAVGVIPAAVPDPEDVERIVLHAAPGIAAPPNVLLTIVDGSLVNWTPAAMALLYAVEAPYVLEAVWREDEESPYQRTKVADMPEGVDVLETGLLPHIFAGEDV
jgi:hypothetical protein